ncbi:MAG TPA: DUF763 domain-containing protein [Candidatus Methanoperedenaceae archaeon]|nr:DUF763 domain-containing protein [Candidatus Methanoperedenaceae archaeon]
MRTGIVDLPLHSGKAPRWLFTRMVRLAGRISEAVVLEYGEDELLRRVSDPFWFQAFSCVLGFDWHSSGTTTTTCGALKVALGSGDKGIFVAGGKGKTSRKTPVEIEDMAKKVQFSEEATGRLVYASRMAAKVDSTCVQDGYRLYHHCFMFTENGKWAVVQQGMGGIYARRYHWLSDSMEGFVEEPHRGICCDERRDKVLDMTSHDSEDVRKVSLDLVNDGPEHLRRYFRRQQTLLCDYGETLPQLRMPAHHPVLDIDISERSMEVLKNAYELQPSSYEELIALEGMGPAKVRALALVSELVYGCAPSWQDPAKFSFAHGGKDGYPYPVDRETYDHSVAALADAIEGARMEKKEKLDALRRLHEFI